MNNIEDYLHLFPKVIAWAKEQEESILQNGTPLNEDQKIDAYLVGVQHIDKVRLLEVKEIPSPDDDELKKVGAAVGLLSGAAIGVTFQYGIYIKEGYLKDRSLIVHELVHTMQHERLGGITHFLKAYLLECIAVGYPNGELELEARRMEKEICNGDF